MVQADDAGSYLSLLQLIAITDALLVGHFELQGCYNLCNKFLISFEAEFVIKKKGVEVSFKTLEYVWFDDHNLEFFREHIVELVVREEGVGA